MKAQVRTALIFLTIAASVGIVLRFMQSGVLIANYKYLRHTHSHVALMGWVYNGAFIIIQRLLIKERDKRFKWLFWVTQVTIVGMLFSFPFQGYGAVSITFSTLFIFCSYYLVYLIFRHLANNQATEFLFLKWGSFYLVLSSFGPFALGYLMTKELGDSIWYNLSIYWFLHFLYNGFFVFVIFAYLVRYSEGQGRRIFLLMNGSIVPLFALSTLWINPPDALYLLAGVGSLLQIVALIYLIPSIKQEIVHDYFMKLIFKVSLAAYCLKVVSQLVACYGPFQEFVNATVPYAVIGFIHLVMLGFFTLFLVSYFAEQRFLSTGYLLKSGVALLMLGIFFSEALLFSQSLFSYFSINWISNFFRWLTMVSLLMPIGILILTIGAFSERPSTGLFV